ncbi:hypothetical protein Tco_0753981 [Tanacetum coccineum]
MFVCCCWMFAYGSCNIKAVVIPNVNAANMCYHCSVYINAAHGAFWFIHGLMFGSLVEDGDLSGMCISAVVEVFSSILLINGMLNVDATSLAAS